MGPAAPVRRNVETALGRFSVVGSLPPNSGVGFRLASVAAVDKLLSVSRSMSTRRKHMVSMTELWLPILLSAVFVFVVSSIIHMATPMHKGDCKKLPGEDRVLAEMRAQGLAPGSYMFPCPASMKDCSSPEMIAKYKQGPVGFVTVIPSGAPGMGKNLVMWFLFSLVISAFVAHLAAQAFAPGAGFKPVFHLTALAAVLGYAMGALPDTIWKGQKLSITLKFVIDGVIYGVVTGLTFAWLWPAVEITIGQ
jgi:hypothetical protein